jgi:hypothetical protein
MRAARGSHRCTRRTGPRAPNRWQKTRYLYGTLTAADTFVDAGSFAYLFGSAFFQLESGFASVVANPNARR